MNILMISMDYPPVPGGISAHVFELSKTLQKNGHKVSVVTRRRPNQEAYSDEEGLDIYRVSLKYMTLVYGLQIRKFVRNLLPSIQPDVIHIHGMGPLEWYNISHIPLAYTNHTSGYLKRIKKGGMRRMAMLKRHFRKVDLFLAPSEELLHIPFSIDAQKQFISNGVDGEKFISSVETRASIRSALGIQPDEVVAIVTRRLVDKNGVIYLAKSTGLMKNKDVKFIVIGDGPERQAVEDEFKKNCGDRALFLGNKTHDEIVDYYSAADFSILPSLMEATSISGLEAMASGLPLVGTRVGGIPVLIKDGENGYLCDPADPKDLAKTIDKLLDQNLKKFGASSREMVHQQFDWQQIGMKTLEAYKSILG